MPRQPRKAFGGQIYHVMNRGNCRMDIFEKGDDYLSFLKTMEEGRKRTDMRILAFCLMPNHWHMVLWPRKAEDMTLFVQWVAGTHVRRWREKRNLVGDGHLYQGRFKSLPIQRNENLYRMLGYVEGNARRSHKSKRAETWPYSSLYAGKRAAESQVELTPWPVPRPADWVETVNAAIKPEELELLRLHVQRGRPLGSDAWMRQVVREMGLESTVRDRGRPRKVVASKTVKPKSVTNSAKTKVAAEIVARKTATKSAKAKVVAKAVKPKIVAKSVKAKVVAKASKPKTVAKSVKGKIAKK